MTTLTSGRMKVERFPGAGSFLERAERWLTEAEAENNLILAVARRQREAQAAAGDPPYFVVLSSEGKVGGCAFRTPPMKVGITRMPRAGIEPLVEDVARVDGRPRSMAAESGRTPNGSRIGWVFTPPEWRGPR